MNVIQTEIPGNHRAAGSQWGAGCDPGLYGDRFAGETGRYGGAGFRYHADPW